jgi:hypothetical protein
MMSSARDRLQRHRERRANGLAVYSIVLNEVDLAAYLVKVGHLDELFCDRHDAVERALQTYFADMIRHDFSTITNRQSR